MTPTDPRPPHRSQAFFEPYPGETAATAMPVQELETPEAYAALSVADTPLARAVLRLAFLASGFSRFHRRLPRALDAMVEESYHNIGATGPVVAATMALRDVPGPIDPFTRAAAMLEACWALHAELRAGAFPADAHRGAPLEMRQYLNLFGTCTAFDGERLRLRKSAAVGQVLVLVRGVAQVVDFGTHFVTLPSARIAQVLAEVCGRSDAGGGGSREAGWLTCLPVPLQIEQLRRILQNAACAQAYERITQTFVTLCLDMDAQPETDAEAARLAHSGNCGNRWFHASLQLVVFGNAKAAVICDFNAGLGGNTMMRAAAEICRRSSAARPTRLPSTPDPEVTPLSWPTQCSIDADISAVQALLDSQQATFELPRGRSAFAAHGLDPVPAFAAAVQLAVWRVTGRFARVRQFVSQAKFRAHNVALALVSTPEMRAALEALDAPRQDPAAVRGLLRAAFAAQREQNRRARSYVSVARSLQLYRSRQRGPGGRYANLVLDAAFALLRARALVQPLPPTDVVLSHPDVFSEVPVMGRPGVRLPYVGCFGLHYFIRDDRTTITVMPSTRWTLPNAELITALESSLDRIFEAAGETDRLSSR